MKVIIVGRDASCDIEVNDAKVSRQHLQIVMNDGGQISAIDLNSTNGTVVNGNRIKGECKVSQNDIIKVGDTVLPWQLIMQKLMGGAAPMPQAPRPASSPSGMTPKKEPNNKSKKTLVWIIILVAVLLIGGGVTYYFFMESEKAEQKRIETQEKYIDKYQEISDEKAEAEDQKAMAEIAAKEAEKKAQDAEKAAEEARIKAEQAEQEAKEQAKIAKNTKKNKAEAESKAKNAEEKAKQAKAEADAALAEAEKAKKEAEEQAAAVSAYRAELITMMDDVLDVKIDALSKKDQKAVAEALGLQEVTEKNAKEKLREAFNQAKDQKDFDRMKQIYDSVKNGDQKSREVEKDKLLGDLYESYKNAIGGISKDQMKIVADSLGLEGAKPTNAKSMIDTEIKHAKDEKNVEKMQQIIAVIEQVRQQPEPEQQTAPEGVNAEPEQKEDEGNPDAKAGDMSGDNKAL